MSYVKDILTTPRWPMAQPSMIDIAPRSILTTTHTSARAPYRGKIGTGAAKLFGNFADVVSGMLGLQQTPQLAPAVGHAPQATIMQMAGGGSQISISDLAVQLSTAAIEDRPIGRNDSDFWKTRGTHTLSYINVFGLRNLCPESRARLL